jgi:hypothetical protein
MSSDITLHYPRNTIVNHPFFPVLFKSDLKNLQVVLLQNVHELDLPSNNVKQFLRVSVIKRIADGVLLQEEPNWRFFFPSVPEGIGYIIEIRDSSTTSLARVEDIRVSPVRDIQISCPASGNLNQRACARGTTGEPGLQVECYMFKGKQKFSFPPPNLGANWQTGVVDMSAAVGTSGWTFVAMDTSGASGMVADISIVASGGQNCC